MTSTHSKQAARLTMEQRVELAGDLHRLADGTKVTTAKGNEVRRIARDLEKLNRLERTKSALEVLRISARARR